MGSTSIEKLTHTHTDNASVLSRRFLELLQLLNEIGEGWSLLWVLKHALLSHEPHVPWDVCEGTCRVDDDTSFHFRVSQSSFLLMGHICCLFFCCCCCCCWCCWASSALSRSISIETQSKASFFAVVMLRCRGRVPFSNPLRESTPCNQESLAVRDITSVASSPTLASGFARMRAALQLVGGGEGSVVVEI